MLACPEVGWSADVHDRSPGFLDAVVRVFPLARVSSRPAVRTRVLGGARFEFSNPIQSGSDRNLGQVPRQHRILDALGEDRPEIVGEADLRDPRALPILPNPLDVLVE